MLNLSGLAKAPPVDFAVYLRRKASANENQNARRKVVYVRAHDKDEAKRIALAKPENKAFIVEGVPKEVRL